jgi:two-component system, LuxR family, sensor kinase FixL
VAAVSHEIRNVCAAIGVVHQNLSRSPSLENNKDFEAFGTLIQSLEKIATLDLRKNSDRATSVDLHALLEELQIVVERDLEESGIKLSISYGQDVPEVLADRPSLMQVFLNLIKNSERAMRQQAHKELHITVEVQNQQIFVRFLDSGTGVRNPADLFKPFQQRAESTGLGLYLSRGFMRSFQGDLRFEPTTSGACFVVELAALGKEQAAIYESADESFDRR